MQGPIGVGRDPWRQRTLSDGPSIGGGAADRAAAGGAAASIPTDPADPPTGIRLICPPSDAAASTAKTAMLVGVPEMTPVAPSRLSPSGKLPCASVNT